MKIAEKKRAEALSKSYVKIKGTDVMATTKIFYSLLYVPAFLGFYNSVVFFWLLFGLKLGSWSALKWSFLFSILFPVYLYFAIVEFDSFKAKLRIALLRFRLFVWRKREGVEKIKEITKMKFELEKEISMLIKSYSKTLFSEELREPILNRQYSNIEATEGKQRKVLEKIDRVKKR